MAPEAPELKIPREEARRKLLAQVEAGDALSNRHPSSYDEVDQLARELDRWRDFTREVLRQIGSNESLATEFIQIRYSAYITSMNPTVEQSWRPVLDTIHGYVNNARSIYERLEIIPESIGAKPADRTDPLPTVLGILDRFHVVAKQLRRRHDERNTLDVRDEYDVQDLLNALFLLHFTDVRAEEGSPSVAGSSPRIDFLLKLERTLIEVKMTRSGLTDKKLGDELAVDVQRYRAHPDYDTLVFFIYDPGDYIRQPSSIKDLSGMHNDKRVVVVIKPE